MVKEYRTNGRIRAKEVLVIGIDGKQLGLMSVPDAIKVARQSDVDLVEVAPNAVPPVCRVLDYGKFKYDQEKKEREARKSQKSSALREVRMRTRIGEHDMLRKTDQIREFLSGGDKVKVSILFRGREATHPELGNQLLAKVARALTTDARVETAPMMDRRTMMMILVPGKKEGHVVAAAGVDAKETPDAETKDS